MWIERKQEKARWQQFPEMWLLHHPAKVSKNWETRGGAGVGGGAATAPPPGRRGTRWMDRRDQSGSRVDRRRSELFFFFFFTEVSIWTFSLKRRESRQSGNSRLLSFFFPSTFRQKMSPFSKWKKNYIFLKIFFNFFSSLLALILFRRCSTGWRCLSAPNPAPTAAALIHWIAVEASRSFKCYDEKFFPFFSFFSPWVKSLSLFCFFYSTKRKEHSWVYCIRRNPSYLVLCQIPGTPPPPLPPPRPAPFASSPCWWCRKEVCDCVVVRLCFFVTLSVFPAAPHSSNSSSFFLSSFHLDRWRGGAEDPRWGAG